MGVGRALFLATVTLDCVEAEETWVEATAPVRARTTTKARTMYFMGTTPKVVFTFSRFLWTHQMNQQ